MSLKDLLVSLGLLSLIYANLYFAFYCVMFLLTLVLKLSVFCIRLYFLLKSVSSLILMFAEAVSFQAYHVRR